MEFSGYNLELDRRRIDNVFRLAQRLPPARAAELRERLGGAPADGRRRAADPRLAGPYRNAYVATGYSMLGMTLAQPAGEAMAEMIMTQRRPQVFEPFRVDRFPKAIVRRPGTVAVRSDLGRAEQAAAVDRQ